MKLPGVETNSRGVHCFGDDNQLPCYTRAETRRSYRQKDVRKSRYDTSVIFLISYKYDLDFDNFYVVFSDWCIGL